MIELLLQARRADEAGQLDEAERRYQQVLAADPRNVIALVALARLARRQGDTAGSAELAERALAVDPDNEAARRLRAARAEDGAATTNPGMPGRHAAPADQRDAAPTDQSYDWPWRDLDAQLQRHAPKANPIARLLRRGSRRDPAREDRDTVARDRPDSGHGSERAGGEATEAPEPGERRERG
jgi:tetratricopeptide (TPR) repeat protein